MIRIFEVGGTIRDRILGIQNHDRDFAVEAPSWEAMRAHVHEVASKVFLETPEHLTIRALFPVGNDENGKPRFEARDFVLCRKDGAYSDGRHPDSVGVGTIFDDLARRDFTVNAMAVDIATGELLDPHGGQEDCKNRVLRCVGSAEKRLNEDALRILRAIRFRITKDLNIDREIREILTARGIEGRHWADKLQAISTARIREELHKCLQHDTVRTLQVLSAINPQFTEVIFGGEIWLKPTQESRPKRVDDPELLAKALEAAAAFRSAKP